MRRILWFRRDLRVEDNLLLSLGGEVLPIFIFDTHILDSLSNKDRRVPFIYNAIVKLKAELIERGLDLALFYGKPTEVFEWLLTHTSFDEVCASGDYERYSRERDRDVSHLLPFKWIDDTYIFRPDEVLKSDGSPYLVFTPFYNRCKTLFTSKHLQCAPDASHQKIAFGYDTIHIIEEKHHHTAPISLRSIGFEAGGTDDHLPLTPHEKLSVFSRKIGEYHHNRDFMAMDASSHLSVDLRFGTLSIRSVLRWLSEQKRGGADTEPFFRELIFREFYAMLLYHFPHLDHQNFRYPFHGIADDAKMEQFCTAKTGVPIIDAGVRELLHTGEMHNRVRMICASFFTKNLLLPWQWGERFFAEHLNDYDASSNILSWQWSAGTGVDPQPYFRIFNPYLQAAKFDKEGLYIRTWLPELNHLSPKNLHDEAALNTIQIDGYPKPMVNHKISSQRALEFFSTALH